MVNYCKLLYFKYEEIYNSFKTWTTRWNIIKILIIMLQKRFIAMTPWRLLKDLVAQILFQPKVIPANYYNGGRGSTRSKI